MFVEGTMNVLKHQQGDRRARWGAPAKEANTFFGDAFHTVRATHGGFLELLVDLRTKVVGRADGGDPAQFVRRGGASEYKTEVAGEVSTLQRDAMIEPGTRVVQVLLRQPGRRSATATAVGEDNADYAE